LFAFLTLWLTFHLVVHFSTAYGKIASSLKCWPTTQTQAKIRFLHSLDSSIDNVLLQTNTGSTLLTLQNPKLYLVDTLLQDS